MYDYENHKIKIVISINYNCLKNLIDSLELVISLLIMESLKKSKVKRAYFSEELEHLRVNYDFI